MKARRPCQGISRAIVHPKATKRSPSLPLPAAGGSQIFGAPCFTTALLQFASSCTGACWAVQPLSSGQWVPWGSCKLLSTFVLTGLKTPGECHILSALEDEQDRNKSPHSSSKCLFKRSMFQGSFPLLRKKLGAGSFLPRYHAAVSQEQNHGQEMPQCSFVCFYQLWYGWCFAHLGSCSLLTVL